MLRDKKGILRRLAARLYVPAAVAVVAMMAFAGSASAAAHATSGAAAHHPPALPAASAVKASSAYHSPGYRPSGKVLRIVVTRSRHSAAAPAGAAAGVSCQELDTTVEGIITIWGGVGWYYTQSTYYCWDGVTVTYHSTWTNGSVPGWASALGWQWKGTISGPSFNCFYATGRWCSGNHETSEGQFDFCPIRVGCALTDYPWVDQKEYYNGHWSGNGGY